MNDRAYWGFPAYIPYVHRTCIRRWPIHSVSWTWGYKKQGKFDTVLPAQLHLHKLRHEHMELQSTPVSPAAMGLLVSLKLSWSCSLFWLQVLFLFLFTIHMMRANKSTPPKKHPMATPAAPPLSKTPFLMPEELPPEELPLPDGVVELPPALPCEKSVSR